MQKKQLEDHSLRYYLPHCRHVLTCYYHADDVLNAAEADDIINFSSIHAYEQSTLRPSNPGVGNLLVLLGQNQAQ